MTPALAIRNLRKTYSNGLEALKGIDLEVAPGDFFALLGPNGAGKSTTIGIISSLVNKSAGDVSIFGFDLDRDLSAAKHQIGLVPQEFNFNMWEPVEEILINQAGYYGIPRAEAQSLTEEKLKLLGLWEKRREMARALSGGMKRRLMIARALVHNPRLLILDEPTAGVDIEIRRSMWQLLRELNAAGTTIILTTHYLEEAESLCRNIAIIDEGHIIENTDMRALLDKLHVETLVLYCQKAFTAPPTLPGFVTRLIDSTTVEVDISREQHLSALFRQLDESAIEVLSMRNKANRLEELFLRLVEKGDNKSTATP